jgi:hypothetical protein
VTQSPTEWFDQFPPNEAMDNHTQWCARHWGPCPFFGANGIAALLEVVSIFVEEVVVPAGITPTDHVLGNQKLQETGRLCCWLGDERMYEIWGRHPPAESE